MIYFRTPVSGLVSARACGQLGRRGASSGPVGGRGAGDSWDGRAWDGDGVEGLANVLGWPRVRWRLRDAALVVRVEPGGFPPREHACELVGWDDGIMRCAPVEGGEGVPGSPFARAPWSSAAPAYALRVALAPACPLRTPAHTCAHLPPRLSHLPTTLPATCLPVCPLPATFASAHSSLWA